ncbi:alpha/beta hydrolase [Fervidibacillus halotolerans]|uniref:Carboxylesterase n=1 Tax=Fervidibacillus halotolerans TaxID=2980027 RepID=A0A9E8LY76_9BACI|nr:carboxylesterase [Fervidibacillus halotolerans]WAA11933.1 carboxylesterase [Fervidibacillus halotolerans]
MKIVSPKPFTFHGGKRAVLLLHGFSGDSADVRMLGRFLEKNGYTSHAPIYRGHGGPMENLLNYTPEDWWEDVMAAYEYLKSLGHEEIAVVGLSLGGVFSLKLAYSLPVKGIVPMCAPMYLQSEERMYNGILDKAVAYKRKEKKPEEQIQKEMERFDRTGLRNLLKENGQFINDVRKHIDLIYAPTFVVQGRKDQVIALESAEIIYQQVESPDKSLKWYEKSGHVITIDVEKDQLHEDILRFLNGLNWEE